MSSQFRTPDHGRTSQISVPIQIKYGPKREKPTYHKGATYQGDKKAFRAGHESRRTRADRQIPITQKGRAD